MYAMYVASISNCNHDPRNIEVVKGTHLAFKGRFIAKIEDREQ